MSILDFPYFEGELLNKGGFEMEETVQQESPNPREKSFPMLSLSKSGKVLKADEVANHFGLQRASVNARACGLREKGVRLEVPTRSGLRSLTA